MRNQIRKDFNEFELSGRSLSDFFQTTIFVAKRSGKSYDIQRQKIKHPAITIIFGDKYGYFIDFDYSLLKSRDPITIKLPPLLKFLGFPPLDLKNNYHNCFNIYKIKKIKDSHGKEQMLGVRHHGVPGISPKSNVNIAVDQWPPTEIFWLPSTNLIQNEFFCQTENCGFSSTKMNNLKRHEEICTGIQKITSKQILYGCKNDVVSMLKKMFNIDVPKQSHFCVFDIETFNNGKTLVPVSVAIASTLDDSIYFQRANDHPESGHLLVVEFIKYLLFLQKKLVNAQRQITEIGQFIEKQYESGLINVNKREIRKFMTFFNNYNTLKCFGFNSRYVCPCVITQSNIINYLVNLISLFFFLRL